MIGNGGPELEKGHLNTYQPKSLLSRSLCE
jgi:hypothetical protein